ncbi:MAG TPA: DUF1294 domain-containing protein [Xanthomonadaceae bacterium]|nr:DUF1294 domain-containing protein [Xanthomonadaceae bacterium]
MRYAGRVTDWHDDKGYGFVVHHGGGDRAFLHIKAFERPGRRPVVGDLLSYAMERDARGRLNAVQVRYAGARPIPRKGREATTLRFHPPRRVLALLAFAALALLAWRGVLPWPLLWVYAGASAATFMAYAWDKHAAERGAWRTRESTLHSLALVGGWPGALLAQGVLRHKSSKAEFQWVFWITVLLNCGALAWWLRAAG